MDNRRKKLLIISTSVLLHLLCMFAIFVLYHQPSHDLFTDFDPSKAIDITETLFYDPQNDPYPASQDSQQSSSIFDDWGQFKPRASTLGDSMEIPDGPIGMQMPGGTADGDANVTDDEEISTNISESDLEAQETTSGNNSLEFNPQINYEGNEQLVVSKDKILNDKDIPSSGAKHTSDSNKKKARKALADITRGYLQQLHDEGENLIKTLGGDPNKKPTAEQLKYERYLAKIQWCLQNAHSINQDKCQLQEPINSAMRIYFVLSREGKMTGFKIMQSSGKAYVDQYISALFTYASSSFPPLPAYVKEDHLPLTYTIMVNWNTGSHTGFSRY